MLVAVAAEMSKVLAEQADLVLAEMAAKTAEVGVVQQIAVVVAVEPEVLVAEPVATAEVA